MRFFLIVLVVCMMPLSMLASGELSNRRAPGFSIPDSKIQQHELGDYRGKVVLVEFMQTMCPSCIKLSGILEEVNRKYTGRVQVLSVVVPPTDNTGTVGTFIREHG